MYEKKAPSFDLFLMHTNDIFKRKIYRRKRSKNLCRSLILIIAIRVEPKSTLSKKVENFSSGSPLFKSKHRRLVEKTLTHHAADEFLCFSVTHSSFGGFFSTMSIAVN